MRAKLLFNHEIETIFIKVKYQGKQHIYFSGRQALHGSVSMTSAGQHKLSELRDRLCETQSYK